MEQKRVIHALDPSFDKSPVFLMALGRLVAESSSLEAQLDFFIWHLSSNNQQSAQILTADMDFRRKVDVLSALLHNSMKPEEELRGRAIARVRALHELYNERNDYLHGMWVPSADNEKRGLMRSSTRKGFLKHSFTDVPVTKIEQLADRFNTEAAGLSDLFVEYIVG